MIAIYLLVWRSVFPQPVGRSRFQRAGKLLFTMAMYLIWLRVSLVLYGVSSVAIIPDVISGRSRWRRVVLPACLAAVFFHFVALSEMLAFAHHWVPASLDEIETSLAWLLAVAFFIVYRRYRAISVGLFVLPLVFLLLLFPAAGPDHAPLSSQWMRNGWILLHIALLLAAYTALILSLIASLLYLIQEHRIKNKRVGGVFSHLPSLDTIDQIAFKTLAIGFPCMTAGLLAGAWIAQESVGASYFADPKVLLSVGMWLLYLFLLYVRRHSGLRGRRAVYLSSLVFLVALTVWAANMLSTVHRFAAP